MFTTMIYCMSSRSIVTRKKESRNPPPRHLSLGNDDHVEPTREKPRKIRQLTSAADHAELERHYTFVPPSSSSSLQPTTSWQQRMVNHYHSHLYKEYVLADFRRPGQVGLRWRTEQEVLSGKGQITCGNKHCPSHAVPPPVREDAFVNYNNKTEPSKTEEEEQKRLEGLSHGWGLEDYEVPFSYTDQGSTIPKKELVKLRLCVRCAPLLFAASKKRNPALEAYKARVVLQEQARERSPSRDPAVAASTTNLHSSDEEHGSKDDRSSPLTSNRQSKKRQRR